MEQELVTDLEREGQILDKIQRFLDEIEQNETVTFLDETVSKIALSVVLLYMVRTPMTNNRTM